ncbi:MAG: 50S ribosomal protein L24 [Elusimicrobiales bacterium]|jgi:large subunit ribosomal protein L24|nr:50S ribosomal protein L24 [Elusimicrobiales bacterium]
MKLKKKDMVVVLSGRDKGKKGEIKDVNPDKMTVTVTGVNMISKHARPSKSKPGGIHKMEAPMPASKVQLVCSKCGKPSRPKITVAQSGDKLRACRKCGEAII